jgi:hypothetical protein
VSELQMPIVAVMGNSHALLKRKDADSPPTIPVGLIHDRNRFKDRPRQLQTRPLATTPIGGPPQPDRIYLIHLRHARRRITKDETRSKVTTAGVLPLLE